MEINYENIIENDFEKPIYQGLQKKIIEFLNINNNCSFWDIVRHVGGSERRTIRLLKEMQKAGQISVQNDKFFVEGGQNFFSVCPTCNGKLCICNQNLANKLEKFEQIYNQKPPATFIFDQRPINIQSTINRVAYMLNRMDIRGKDVVLLGDDDLTGIAIALTGLAKSVTVLDIDERLVDYVAQVSKQYNLGITTKVFDATKPVPQDMQGVYDVLLCDPTPEPIPFSIFMNVAIEITRKNAIIYTSIYSSAMEFNYQMQQVMTDRHLHITDMVPNWTEYKSIYNLYRQSDIDTFADYGIDIKDGICFTETFIRTIKTNQTTIIPVNFKPEDLFGKATKRVIKDAKNDVEIADDQYLNKTLSKMRGEDND